MTDIAIGDVPLAAVGIGAGVSHGHNAFFIMGQALVDLVRDVIPGTTSTGATRVTGLRHKSGNDAVERDIVEPPVLRKENEAVYRQRR